MSNIKKREYIKKRKTFPQPTSDVLDSFTTKEQRALLRKLVKQGAAFIVLGSQNSPKAEFYKGLCQEMRQPTSNGVSCYDSRVPYKNQFDRDVITISINDWGNSNYVDSIKRLDGVRTRTLYTFNYGENVSD